MFKFDLNLFQSFKEYFFKVKATNVIVDGLPLMHDGNKKPHFHFYWQSNLTRFKSFNECLMSPEKGTDKAILEWVPTFLDPWAILSLPVAANPLSILNGKVSFLFFLFVRYNFVFSYIFYVFICLCRHNTQFWMVALGKADWTCWKWCASSSPHHLWDFFQAKRHIISRIDLPWASKAGEDENVKVTLDMLPPLATKSKCSEGTLRSSFP